MKIVIHYNAWNVVFIGNKVKFSLTFNISKTNYICILKQNNVRNAKYILKKFQAAITWRVINVSMNIVGYA